jgi:hypothetical protein
MLDSGAPGEDTSLGSVVAGLLLRTLLDSSRVSCAGGGGGVNCHDAPKWP